jgi:protein SCO1/2
MPVAFPPPVAAPLPGRLAALLLACTPLAACGGGTGEANPEPPLAGAAIGGPFELVSETGDTVRWSDFEGRYRMIYFGYAYCPDVCPLDLQRMMQGYQAFAREKPELAAQVQPLFVTIDPARDTPQVVGEFTANFGDELVGLTGTQEQVDSAAKAFAVYYAKGEESSGGGYLMDHSRSAFLMDREGEPIALLPVEQSGQAVAEELVRWVS